MSCVTSIILITSPGDGGMMSFNTWLESRDLHPLAETSDHANSKGKPMHIDVWQGAYNYFPVTREEFLLQIYATKWDIKEDLVLIWNDEGVSCGHLLAFSEKGNSVERLTLS